MSTKNCVGQKIYLVRCCVGQTLRLSDIASVRRCVGQTLRRSNVASFRHCVGQTLRRSDVASVRRCVGQMLRRSDVASVRWRVGQTACRPDGFRSKEVAPFSSWMKQWLHSRANVTNNLRLYFTTVIFCNIRPKVSMNSSLESLANKPGLNVAKCPINKYVCAHAWHFLVSLYL